MARSDVVVVGAGVAGLTTSIVLAERGLRVHVTARETTPRTTSDVPGALWYPFKAEPLGRVIGWAGVTHRRLATIAADPTSGVTVRPGLEVFRAPVGEPWWRAAVPEYRRARGDELPPGFVDGYAFTAPVMETPLYMPWLLARARALGVRLEETHVSDLRDACPPGGVLVHCTGLGARALARDDRVYPSRGQLVLLEPLPLARFTLDEAVRDRITYVIPRRDAVVLGGTVEDGVESLAPDPRAAAAILERARQIAPEIAGAKVLRTAVGLRPCRGEVRLELEALEGGRSVVHNYGHGGAGFTLSWGAAEEAAALAVKALGG